MASRRLALPLVEFHASDAGYAVMSIMKTTRFTSILLALLVQALPLSRSNAQGPSGAGVVDLGGGCGNGCTGGTLGAYYTVDPLGSPAIYFCADTSYNELAPKNLFVIVIGASTTSIDLSMFAPGCTLVVSPDFLQPTGAFCGSCAGAMGCGGGAGCWGYGRYALVSVPSDPGLVGVTVFAQGVIGSYGVGSPFELGLSNSLAITLT